MDFWIQSGIGLLVGIAFAILVEINISGANKHFWAIIVFVFSSTFGILFAFLFDTRDQISDSISNMQEVARDIKSRLSSNAQTLHPGVGVFWQDVDSNILDNLNEFIRDQMQKEIQDLSMAFQAGYVPIAHGREKFVLGELFEHAHRNYIIDEDARPPALPFFIATNYGSTQKYFGVGETYYKSHHATLKNDFGIPLVRFFVLESKDERETFMSNFDAIREDFPMTMAGIVYCDRCIGYRLCGQNSEDGITTDVLMLEFIKNSKGLAEGTGSDWNAIMLEEQLNDAGGSKGVKATSLKSHIDEAKSSLIHAWKCSGDERTGERSFSIDTGSDLTSPTAHPYHRYINDLELNEQDGPWDIQLVEYIFARGLN